MGICGCIIFAEMVLIADIYLCTVCHYAKQHSKLILNINVDTDLSVHFYFRQYQNYYFKMPDKSEQ